MSQAQLDYRFHHRATRGYHYLVMLLYTQFKNGRPTENMVRCLSLQWDLMYACCPSVTNWWRYTHHIWYHWNMCGYGAILSVMAEKMWMTSSNQHSQAFPLWMVIGVMQMTFSERTDALSRFICPRAIQSFQCCTQHCPQPTGVEKNMCMVGAKDPHRQSESLLWHSVCVLLPCLSHHRQDMLFWNKKCYTTECLI
jgi:hypothetical protein